MNYIIHNNELHVLVKKYYYINFFDKFKVKKNIFRKSPDPPLILEK